VHSGDETLNRAGSSKSPSRERLERKIPKLIKLKSRGLKMVAALPENANAKYEDDDEPVGRMNLAL
jgi:hypothetical protein